MQRIERERFYSLDFLRGMAAISIVFWHWKHFFFTVSGPQEELAFSLPLYSAFGLFYQKGRLAVELFYSLSGFIFFWLYSDNISNKTISGRSFFILRFSRLYPLHFACIWLTLILQWIYKSMNGSFFIYAFNDTYHTVLNLLFIQSWGMEKGYSLDGPTWSVSIEVLVYILFFIFASSRILRKSVVAIVIALAVLYLKWIPAQIQMGIFCFFSGGFVYRLYCMIKGRRGVATSILLWSSTCIAWVVAFKSFDTSGLERLAITFPVMAKPIHFAIYLYPQAVLFPLTILTLAVSESDWKHIWKKAGGIGDITYSSYLLHFPLQLVFMLVSESSGIERVFYTTPLSMFFFFIVLVSISMLSHRKFEMPFQAWLRNRLVAN